MGATVEFKLKNNQSPGLGNHRPWYLPNCSDIRSLRNCGEGNSNITLHDYLICSELLKQLLFAGWKNI